MRLAASSFAILALAGSALTAATASADPLAPSSAPSLFGPPATSPPREAAPELSSPTVMVKAASENAAQEIAARHGLTVSRGFPWIGWYELATAPGTTDASAAKAALDADDAVEATDALAKDEDLSLTYTPKDPIFSGGATFNGQPIGWSFTNANFPSAWDRTTGAGASIGIIDSEFDTSHPDLQAKVRNPYNTASGTANYHTGNVQAVPGVDDVNVLHGTHVAGIAAASTDNGIGTAGGGFDATFVPVRIKTSFQPGGGNPVDAAFVGDLTEALGYIASQPVGVVTMSLGTTRNHPPMAGRDQRGPRPRHHGHRIGGQLPADRAQRGDLPGVLPGRDRHRQHPGQRHDQPVVVERQLGRRVRARHRHLLHLGHARPQAGLSRRR